MEGNTNGAAPPARPRSIYEVWATDRKAEQEGVPVSYGDAAEFLVLRAGKCNPRFTERITALVRKYQRQIELDLINDMAVRPEIVAIYAETVIAGGWFIDRDGKRQELRGNPELVKKIFLELPDMFDDVRKVADTPAAFKEILREQEAKN